MLTKLGKGIFKYEKSCSVFVITGCSGQKEAVLFENLNRRCASYDTIFKPIQMYSPLFPLTRSTKWWPAYLTVSVPATGQARGDLTHSERIPVQQEKSNFDIDFIVMKCWHNQADVSERVRESSPSSHKTSGTQDFCEGHNLNTYSRVGYSSEEHGSGL